MVDSNPTDHAAHSTSPAASLSAEAVARRIMEQIEAHQKEAADPSPYRKLPPIVGVYALFSGIKTTVSDALEALTAERDRLAAEATINDGRATYWRKRYVALGNEVIDRSGVAEADWYTRHRRRVEAAHAAAKQAKREAECRNCRDGFPAYINPADWDTCPDCGKKFGGAKEVAE